LKVVQYMTTVGVPVKAPYQLLLRRHRPLTQSATVLRVLIAAGIETAWKNTTHVKEERMATLLSMRRGIAISSLTTTTTLVNLVGSGSMECDSASNSL